MSDNFAQRPAQHIAYPERRYLVLPLASPLPSGAYRADFEIYEGAVTGTPAYRCDGGQRSFASEMAARTAIQNAASDWIDEHPLK
jgi:hypothetical protein